MTLCFEFFSVFDVKHYFESYMIISYGFVVLSFFHSNNLTNVRPAIV